MESSNHRSATAIVRAGTAVCLAFTAIVVRAPSPVAAADGCGNWQVVPATPGRDTRIRAEIARANTSDKCEVVLLIRNESGAWGIGGYTLEMKPTFGSTLGKWTPERLERTAYVLPGEEVELHAEPLSKSSPAEITLLGDQTVGTMATDATLFLLHIALEAVPFSCVVPEEQIFFAALRTSDIVHSSIQLALRGDLIGSRAELSMILPSFYHRASDALKEAGVNCAAHAVDEVIEWLVKKPTFVAQIVLAYLSWIGKTLFDYFTAHGELPELHITYTPVDAAVAQPPIPAIALFGVEMYSADVGWAVGEQGLILFYDGRIWSDMDSRTASTLYDVSIVSRTDAVVVGDQGATLRWNGTDWIPMGSPSDQGYYAVQMLNAMDGWAVGQGGLIAHWDGAAWTKTASPTRNGLSTVAMSSSTDGWAAGTGGVLLHWDGASWTLYNSPTTNNIASIDMVSDSDGWAVTSRCSLCQPTSLHLNGTNWTVIELPSFRGFTSVSMVAPDDVWAVSIWNEFAHWNGRAWNVITYPRAGGMNAVDMVSAADGWAVGYGGSIVHWDGMAWTRITPDASQPIATLTPAPTTTAAPVDAGAFGPQAIWDAPDGFFKFQDCQYQSPSPLECVLSLMQSMQAHAQALEFTRLLRGEGYMSAFTEHGRVDVALVTFPARANDNWQYVLINGTPRLVFALDVGAIDISAASNYVELARQYPQVMLWPGDAQFDHVETSAAGGQRFVFSYPLVNGCHACEQAGRALIAFDFSSAGDFTGSSLLSLEP